MSNMMFVNLITDDLPASRGFYEALGWEIDPDFSDENAICVVISEHNYLMVLRREFYETFIEGTGKVTGDPRATSLVLVAFTLPSRDAVDELANRVREAGGKVDSAIDRGFMYQVAFEDLDGNRFEPFSINQPDS